MKSARDGIDDAPLLSWPSAVLRRVLLRVDVGCFGGIVCDCNWDFPISPLDVDCKT